MDSSTPAVEGWRALVAAASETMARKLCSNRSAAFGVGQCADSSSSAGSPALQREGNVLGIAQQIVHIRPVALQGKRDAAANGNPDGMGRGDRFGGCEDVRGRVRGGGCGDQVGRAVEREIGRELGGAGNNAAGNREQFGAGGGNQDVVGVTERLEKRLRRGRELRVKR